MCRCVLLTFPLRGVTLCYISAADYTRMGCEAWTGEQSLVSIPPILWFQVCLLWCMCTKTSVSSPFLWSSHAGTSCGQAEEVVVVVARVKMVQIPLLLSFILRVYFLLWCVCPAEGPCLLILSVIWPQGG